MESDYPDFIFEYNRGYLDGLKDAVVLCEKIHQQYFNRWKEDDTMEQDVLGARVCVLRIRKLIDEAEFDKGGK